MRLIFYGVAWVLIVPAGEEVGGGLADHVPVDDVAAECAGGVEPVLDLFGRPVGDVKDAVRPHLSQKSDAGAVTTRSKSAAMRGWATLWFWRDTVLCITLFETFNHFFSDIYTPVCERCS